MSIRIIYGHTLYIFLATEKKYTSEKQQQQQQQLKKKKSVS